MLFFSDSLYVRSSSCRSMSERMPATPTADPTTAVTVSRGYGERRARKAAPNMKPISSSVWLLPFTLMLRSLESAALTNSPPP